MQYRAVLFDLDGTLTNTLPDLTFITNETLKELGYPERTEDEVRRFVGNGMKKLLERALPAGVPLTPEISEKMTANYLKYQNRLTRVYDGIPELLAGLKADGMKLGVISNKPDKASQAVVDYYLPGVFDFVTGQREDMRTKPYPDLSELAFQALQVEPCECIYVGDSETDIETGENAHMLTISAAWGFRDVETLKFYGACHIAANPAELLSCIRYLA